jgi:hypothetical protein
MNKEFRECFTKWRKSMKDGSLGPLLIAEDVVAQAKHWEPKENDGRSYSGALEDILGDGKGIRFFQIRAGAVVALKVHRAQHLFHHEAAVWLTAKAQEKKLEACVKEAAVAYNQNHRVPLTRAQVHRACREVLGFRPRTRVDSGVDKDLIIEKLQNLLAKREAEIADLRSQLEVLKRPQTKMLE